MEEVASTSTLFNQNATDAGNMVQLVTFELANENFGIDILQVQEIAQMTKITRVPNAPHYVKGVINLRGKVIPVVDLRLRLDLPPKEIDANSRIIVVQLENKIIGMIVDRMREVVWVSSSNIESSPSETDSKVGENYISGIVNLPDRLIILLDLNKVFGIHKEN